MTDSNNIPQEAKQLSEDLASQDEGTNKKAQQDMAKTNFDEEYEQAQQSSGGSGNQSSDSNPVSRKAESAASDSGSAPSGSASGGAGRSREAGKIDDIDSPGNSDPDDYLDMARSINKDRSDS